MSAHLAYHGDMPRVNGRHRNGALAQARRLRAARLIVSGCTYQEVADRLGYQNRGTVHRLVQPVLRTTRPGNLDEAFQIHLARLESLLAANFEMALARDVRATRTVLQVLREVSALLKLFDVDPPQHEERYEVIDPVELVRRSRERQRQTD